MTKAGLGLRGTAALAHHFRQPAHLMNARAAVQLHQFIPSQGPPGRIAFLRAERKMLEIDLEHHTRPARSAEGGRAVPVHQHVANGARAKTRGKLDGTHDRKMK